MRRYLLSFALCIAALNGVARAATPQQVDDAVKKAIANLYQIQKNGNWENVPAQEGEKWDSTEGTQWGGITGVVTYALLSADEKSTETHVAAAVQGHQQHQLPGALR